VAARDNLLFSIVIPTRNRATSLVQCLKSLAELAYPNDRYEVIVVDDGGDASIVKLIEPFHDRFTLHVLAQFHSGPAAARNYGVAHARGNFLAFVDDDCEVHSGWLDALAARVIREPGRLLGGKTVNRLRKNPYSEASQALVTYLYQYYNANPDSAQFFTSSNLAVPKAEFTSLGGFDIGFTRAAAEDRDFCDRWLGRGYAMRYVPDAVVYHSHALTPSSFMMQHVNYGRGAWHFQVRRIQRTHQRIRLEPARFYLGLLGSPFIAEHPCRAFHKMALLLLAQLANATGFLLEMTS
jgi:glycosyltransferase involved in cell wall biosynthesis